MKNTSLCFFLISATNFKMADEYEDNDFDDDYQEVDEPEEMDDIGNEEENVEGDTENVEILPSDQGEG